MIKTKYHLTFDIDWAPDFCIEPILKNLKKKKIKATFFVTHKTDIIADIYRDGHNIGIHPNFFKGSTQGKGNLNIVENLLSLSKNINSIRIHGLLQSTNLLYEIFKNFSELKYDFTIYTPTISSHKFSWKYDDVSFLRYNYNWEDDFCFGQNFPEFSDLKLLKKMIFNFHPIHIFLNSNKFENYNKLKSKYNLVKLNEKNAKKFINHEKLGSLKLFNQIISSDLKVFNPISLK